MLILQLLRKLVVAVVVQLRKLKLLLKQKKQLLQLKKVLKIQKLNFSLGILVIPDIKRSHRNAMASFYILCTIRM
ncbi:hypothetical protein FQZ97_1085430 [compost metagenome]